MPPDRGAATAKIFRDNASAIGSLAWSQWLHPKVRTSHPGCPAVSSSSVPRSAVARSGLPLRDSPVVRSVKASQSVASALYINNRPQMPNLWQAEEEIIASKSSSFICICRPFQHPLSPLIVI
jgi:hypothetical protein